MDECGTVNVSIGSRPNMFENNAFSWGSDCCGRHLNRICFIASPGDMVDSCVLLMMFHCIYRFVIRPDLDFEVASVFVKLARLSCYCKLVNDFHLCLNFSSLIDSNQSGQLYFAVPLLLGDFEWENTSVRKTITLLFPSYTQS